MEVMKNAAIGPRRPNVNNTAPPAMASPHAVHRSRRESSTSHNTGLISSSARRLCDFPARISPDKSRRQNPAPSEGSIKCGKDQAANPKNIQPNKWVKPSDSQKVRAWYIYPASLANRKGSAGLSVLK